MSGTSARLPYLAYVDYVSVVSPAAAKPSELNRVRRARLAPGYFTIAQVLGKDFEYPAPWPAVLKFHLGCRPTQLPADAHVFTTSPALALMDGGPMLGRSVSGTICCLKTTVQYVTFLPRAVCQTGSKRLDCRWEPQSSKNGRRPCEKTSTVGPNNVVRQVVLEPRSRSS